MKENTAARIIQKKVRNLQNKKHKAAKTIQSTQR